MSAPATAATARLLADAAGWALDYFVDAPVERASTLLAEGKTHIAIMALASDVTDSALMALIAAERCWMNSCSPSSCMPSFGLITGRDPTALRRTVNAIVAGRNIFRPHPRLRLFSVGGNLVQATELIMGSATVEGATRSNSLSGPGLELALRQSVDALALETHGTESCARGDGRIVFCGRVPGTRSGPADRALACGHGHPCPKGDRPFPLHGLNARAIILASCSSLRLGDAALEHDFNLGLSCLDGPIEAYVGSIFASGGNRVASRAILACLASGETLGRATAYANALVRAGRLDHGTRVCVAPPDFRLVDGSGLPEVEASDGVRGAVTIACGDARAATVQLGDPMALALASAGRLVLQVDTESPGSNTAWFARIEGAGADARLRLFLFRFPEALGCLTLRFADFDTVVERARAPLERLRLWSDYLRLATGATDDHASEVIALMEESRHVIDRALVGVHCEGAVLVDLERAGAVVDGAAATLRTAATAALVEQLGRAFWLPNVLAPTQRLCVSEMSTCRHCGGVALSQVFADEVTRTKRSTVVCARCAIVSDITEGGPVVDLAAECEGHAVAGHRLDLQVRIRLRPATVGTELCVYPRLSTPGFGVIVSSPANAVHTADGVAEVSLPFHFELPEDLVPHYYTVKILVSTPSHLSFGARRLMVSTKRG